MKDWLRIKIVSICCLVFAILSARGAVLAQAPASAPAQNYGVEKYRLVNQADEIVSVLDNGLTVIVKRVPSPVVAVRAYARTGGVYEGKWLGGGLSHLLEHLVAGGTNHRRTEEQNRNLLQRIGNNSNAYTTYDHTCFYVNTTTGHLDEAVDLVAGWMLGAAITPAEYAREYQVVQRELEMNKGQPDSVFWNLTQLNRYRISPARVPVIGYQEVIQGLSRDDVYGYYRLAYQPNNLVFCVAGDIDPEKMLAVVRANVADAPHGREFSHELPPEPPVLAPRALVATFPKLGQARLDLGFASVREDDPDLYALDLLSTILGSGESSMLIQELRDRRQIVSSVTCGDYTPAFVEGTFSISMELDADKIPAASAAVLDQIEKIKNELIDPQRIQRAKTQLQAAHVKDLQTSEAIAASLATDLLSSGDPHFSDRYVQRIGKVTAQQLQEVARKYLNPAQLLTTALLPEESPQSDGLPKAQDLLRPVAPTTQARLGPSTAPTVTRLQLGNGVILLHKHLATAPIVEVRMYAAGGLTVEDDQTNGLGNLTMEMAPRGTPSRSAGQIAEFLDSIGGDLDCACGNNTWYWNMTCLKGDLPRAMEVYGDIVNNASFPDAELSLAKLRVQAGIQSQDADWHTQALRFFREQFFGPAKSPYRFMPIGKNAVVAQAGTEQLRQWYRGKVLKSRRVLAIYGDVDLDQARSLAQQYLGGSENVDTSVGLPAPDELKPASGQPAVNVLRVEVQKTQQALAGIVIGYQSDTVLSQPSRIPLTVLTTMTSGYDYPTGYLFDILRGRGLVYTVSATAMPGIRADLPGAFIATAGCDPAKVNQVVDVMLENIARCQGTDQDMQTDWFERSRQLIVTGDAMDNQTPAQQATTAALDELFGLGYDYHFGFAQRINAVTIEQVRQVARSRLRECVVTVSTPAPDLVDRQTGMRTYSSFGPVDLTPRGVQHDTGK